VKELRVPLEAGTSTTAIIYQAAQSAPQPRAILVLAHGAGANQRSVFMVEFVTALAGLGLGVVTFNFPYTEAGRRVPDRGPVLEACYRAVVGLVADHLGPTRLFVGGKSMGGRIATQVAAADPDWPISGLVLLGYPLHPPGRPETRRDRHLPHVGRPMLFVQGSRDSFGTPQELGPVLDGLSPRPTLHVVEGGDHSFKLSRRDSAEQAGAYVRVQRTIIEWVAGVDAG